MVTKEEVDEAANILCKELQNVQPNDYFAENDKTCADMTWLDFYRPVARFALEAAEKARDKQKDEEIVELNINN